MTRSLGGVDVSHDAPTSSTRRPIDWPTLPSDAPDGLRQGSIYLKDPAHVLAIHKAQRRKGFQNLVRRYVAQLVYGCGHPACTTPTCFTFKEKVSPGPVRRLTPVSARTVACYLAARENPESALCPYGALSEPRKDALNARPSPSNKKDKLRRVTIDEEPSHITPHKSHSRTRSKGKGVSGTTLPAASSLKNEEDRQQEDVTNGSKPTENSPNPIVGRKQKQKDPKSFTQNLFDTLALKMLEWLPLPDPVGPFPVAPLANKPTASNGTIHGLDDKPAEEENEINENPTPVNERTPEIDPVQPQESHPTEVADIPLHDQEGPSNGTSVSQDETGDLEKPQPNPPHEMVDSTTPQGRSRPARTPTRPSKGYNSREDIEEGFPNHRHSIIAQLDCWSDPKPQSLSHLTIANTEALVGLAKSSASSASEDHEAALKQRGRAGQAAQIKSTESVVRHQQAMAFTGQSIFYGLGNADAVLKSFRDSTDLSKTSAESDLLRKALRSLLKQRYNLVFHSLWLGLGHLFNAPPELIPPKSPRLRPALSNATVTIGSSSPREDDATVPLKHFDDSEAAHVIMLSLEALAAALPQHLSDAGFALRTVRSHGKIGPDVSLEKADATVVHKAREVLSCLDALESGQPLRLVARMSRAISAREYYTEALRTKSQTQEPLMTIPTEEMHLKKLLLNSIERAYNADDQKPDAITGIKWSLPTMTVEWVRTIILKEWDGKPEISRFGIVGGAVTFLSYLYEARDRIGLTTEMFSMPFFADRLDPTEMPLEWLSTTPNSKTIHLLSHPFLFPPSTLVTYFRALNFSNMSRAFESAMMTLRMIIHMSHADSTNAGLFNRMRTAISTYLVVEIRREYVLLDAMNQLWRREKRELMRPLKVRMGLEEGEEGVDHGGVQQEFFRMAIAEALNPDYGVFTTDSRTHISWFQPCSLEPIYKFELLGLLVSLAIYNGTTLPLNFPLALYRKLLGLPVELEHLSDGWPELSKGLSDLLSWEDGDVGDVFVRTYEFSVESCGRVINVDMEKVGKDDPWPERTKSSAGKGKAVLSKGPDNASLASIEEEHSEDKSKGQLDVVPSTADEILLPGSLLGLDDDGSSASLVTNENREQFVKDYVYWLTDRSIRPQYEAFTKGFLACLDKKAISIFTPSALRTVVEGIEDVDVDELQKTTRYEDGFNASHRLMRDFWSIVRGYTPEKKRQLLEFVTASDRVPANGAGSILFVIQRNGPDSDRVPTSLTCFGRLLLPEYSSKRKLKEKLRLALENGKGFGVP
ncbi:MAG: hypothetical protein M4579_000405 [Chaenotheca gracillima]|nr:MAG: hypothetical protein M4579_000405 [Chaenotheca gracillima]